VIATHQRVQAANWPLILRKAIDTPKAILSENSVFLEIAFVDFDKIAAIYFR
jgi:hypothetical protein